MRIWIRLIHRVNFWVGKGVSFLLVAMMATVCFEVLSRYAFNRPTLWSFDLNTNLLCVYSLLGGGYTLLRKSHVRVDILHARLSPRTQCLLDCLTSLLLFLFTTVLIWEGVHIGIQSWLQKETSGTILEWPLFPTKFMVPLGAFLLLLQGTAKLLEDLTSAVTGRPIKDREEGPFGRREGG